MFETGPVEILIRVPIHENHYKLFYELLNEFLRNRQQHVSFELGRGKFDNNAYTYTARFGDYILITSFVATDGTTFIVKTILGNQKESAATCADVLREIRAELNEFFVKKGLKFR